MASEKVTLYLYDLSRGISFFYKRKKNSLIKIIKDNCNLFKFKYI